MSLATLTTETPSTTYQLLTGGWRRGASREVTLLGNLKHRGTRAVWVGLASLSLKPPKRSTQFYITSTK